MNRDLYQKYILCVHESDSLTQAAKKLGISQPALSSGLNSAEKKLGFKLFNRKTTPPKLTKEGEIYLEYLKKEQQLEEDFQKKIADSRQMEGGKIVIGGPVAYVESIITRAVAEFHAIQPTCEILIKNEPVPELIKKLQSGEVDCFISTSEDLPVMCKKIFLKKEKICMCVPKDWEINSLLSGSDTGGRKAAEAFDCQALCGREFIFLEDNQPLQKEMISFFEQNQIVPQNYLRVNQVSAALRLSCLGAGISFVSEDSLVGNPQSEQVCVYSLPDSISKRNIYIVYNGERYLTNACQKLIEILKKYAEGGC